MKILRAFALVLLFAFSILAQPNAPRIEKVEPPNWWANYSVNPVRLLIRGANLQGARVKATSKNITAGNVRVNSRGDYAFVDVSINKNAVAGSASFLLATTNGNVVAPFRINEPLDAKTNFQGITNDDVIYLIMPDRFANGDESNDNPPNSDKAANDRGNPRAWHGGDLRGVQDHLDYLKELGVTAIWLTPWYDNDNAVTNCPHPWCPATSYHGYGAIDYYAVEDHFGTMRDLRNLIAAAHRKGLKVIQDQVANHVSSKHSWLKNPPLDDWFSPFEKNSFNNSVLLSPNASQAERDNLIHGWFDEGLPDLNQDEPEVAKYEIQNALWWIGISGIDGIRQDTIQYLPRPFIRDWSTAILRQYPKFWMVGEVFERDAAQTAFFQGGKTGWDGVDTKLPSVFDFKLWETSQQVFTNKKPMRALRDVLKYDGLYADVNNLTTITGNHDTERFMSLDGATIAGAKLHIAFLLSARGIPQIYSGEEIAMRGAADPDNRRDFPGGWRDDSHNAFTKQGRTAEEQAMFEWTQKWLKLRGENLAIKKGTTVDLFYDNDVYIFERHFPLIDWVATAVVAINNSNREKELTINYKIPKSVGLQTVTFRPLISDGEKVTTIGNKVTFKLLPKTAVVYGY